MDSSNQKYKIRLINTTSIPIANKFFVTINQNQTDFTKDDVGYLFSNGSKTGNNNL
jgi:hypothetical protein